MPINYKLYPKDWKTVIRPAILERAENKCELCKAPNHAFGYRDEGDFIWSDGLQQEADILDGKKIIKIVLTIAHLDHDISNNDYGNLRALCQQCHLRHDAKHHKRTRKYGNNNQQMELI
jgi:hypothetical protein